MVMFKTQMVKELAIEIDRAKKNFVSLEAFNRAERMLKREIEILNGKQEFDKGSTEAFMIGCEAIDESTKEKEKAINELIEEGYIFEKRFDLKVGPAHGYRPYYGFTQKGWRLVADLRENGYLKDKEN